MFMFRHIETLQSKSESTRRTTALVVTLALFAGVVGLWLHTNSTAVNAEPAQESTGATVASPIETVKSMFDGFKKEFDDFQKNDVPAL